MAEAQIGAGPPVEPAEDQAADKRRERLHVGLPDVDHEERDDGHDHRERPDRAQQSEHQEAAQEELRRHQVQDVRQEDVGHRGHRRAVPVPDGRDRRDDGDGGHGHQDRQPTEDHCPPDVPATQAVPARVLAQREQDAQRHEAEEHEPLDPLVAQAPRIERTEAGQHVVVAVQHQERAGEEQERRGERRHAQPQEVELDPVARRRPRGRRIADEELGHAGAEGHGRTGYQSGGARCSPAGAADDTGLMARASRLRAEVA